MHARDQDGPFSADAHNRVSWSTVRRLWPVCGALAVAVALLAWGLVAADAPVQQLLGMDVVGAAVIPQDLTIIVSPRTRTFSPDVAAVVSGSRVRFTNSLATPVEVAMTALAPAQFHFRLGAHATVAVRLDRPGLYHYYDVLTAAPGAVLAGSMTLKPRTLTVAPRQGWIAVVDAIPGLNEQLTVPVNQDVFEPKVLVAVVGSTIAVVNHDNEAHNFVVDPASPAGAAFIVDGTDTQPPAGGRRVLVAQQAGLYHVYCTLHSRIIGLRDGWRVIAPTSKASGFAAGDPMEAWIVVLPATVEVPQ